MPRDKEAERAIEALRQIQTLARDELATKLGGAMSAETMRILSYWIARAWEAGRDYKR